MAEAKPTVTVETGGLTIADLGALYLADLRSEARKQATLVGVESILRIGLAPFFGDKDVRRITKPDVEDLMRSMKSGKRPGEREKGDRRYGKLVGPKSIRNYVGTLSALLNFAIREGRLTENVARHVKLPPAPSDGEIRFLTVEEVEAPWQRPSQASTRASTACSTSLQR